MKSHIYQRYLLCLVVGVTLQACPSPPTGPRFVGAGASEPQYGGTLTYSVTSNIRSLSPFIGYDVYSNQAMRVLWDGLLDYDESGVLIPAMLESVPTPGGPDGRTYRFTLRPGIHFHDSPVFPGGKGRELVADDIAWSLTKLLDPSTHSPGFSFYMSIEGVEAFRAGKSKTISGIKTIDKYSVDITLAKADQGFLNAMALSFAYPVAKEAWQHWGEKIQFHPVGTGPFVLDEWERDVRIVFKKNENYWRDGLPYLDQMIVYENIGIEVAAMRLRNGDQDHLYDARQPDYLILNQQEGWKDSFVMAPGGTVYGIALNNEIPPFDNIHVRRAVAFALNRQKFERLSKGRRIPTGQMMPPGIFGHFVDLEEAQTFDPKRAKEEMKLAGYPDGYPKKITLINHDSASAKSSAELIQADLKEIGIDIEIRPMAFALYLQETATRGRAQMFITGWHQDFPDPISFFDMLLHSRNIKDVNAENRAFYSNPELDELLDKAKASPDRTEREQLYRKASNIVSHDAPWAFLFNTVTPEWWQPYVKNYKPHVTHTCDLRFAWLDLPKKRVQ